MECIEWRPGARSAGDGGLEPSHPVHAVCRSRHDLICAPYPDCLSPCTPSSFDCLVTQVGVGIFVDNAEGAFLQSPTAGPVCSLLPGSDPEATACALDPVAASASAAALLHTQPVAHVDAEASSKVT